MLITIYVVPTSFVDLVQLMQNTNEIEYIAEYEAYDIGYRHRQIDGCGWYQVSLTVEEYDKLKSYDHLRRTFLNIKNKTNESN